jgi:hypothetical protein
LPTTEIGIKRNETHLKRRMKSEDDRWQTREDHQVQECAPQAGYRLYFSWHRWVAIVPRSRVSHYWNGMSGLVTEAPRAAIKVTKSREGISDLMGFGATSESLQSMVRSCEPFLNGILVTRVINSKIPMEFNETKLLLDGSGRMICCDCHISEASTWTW